MMLLGVTSLSQSCHLHSSGAVKSVKRPWDLQLRLLIGESGGNGAAGDQHLLELKMNVEEAVARVSSHLEQRQHASSDGLRLHAWP